jgi:hypothetical protein
VYVENASSAPAMSGGLIFFDLDRPYGGSAVHFGGAAQNGNYNGAWKFAEPNFAIMFAEHVLPRLTRWATQEVRFDDFVVPDTLELLQAFEDDIGSAGFLSNIEAYEAKHNG